MKAKLLKFTPARRMICAFALIALLSSTARAEKPLATPEDFFKSMQNEVNETTDMGKFVAVIAGGIGLIILLALVSQRKQRIARPRTRSHPGKLIREVLKAVPLRKVEMKQLKLLVEYGKANGDERIQSPLTLLLCPSVFAKCLKSPPPKLDRRVIAAVARKLAASNAALRMQEPRRAAT